jgi:tetratricopeptide (TPR) repeat protein
MLVTFSGVVSLVYQQRSIKHQGTDGWGFQTIDDTLHFLINRIIPGIIVVSSAMVFLFILNIDEISPQGKLVPDYSMFIILAFGFALFYSLNFFFRSLSIRRLTIFLEPLALIVLIFLLAFGTLKIYRVYGAYRNVFRSKEVLGERDSRSREKPWHDVLMLNQTPKIKSIDTEAMVELGRIRMEQGKFRQASSYYEKILADQAFNFEANLGLAQVAFIQKKWRKSSEAYRRVIYLRPKERYYYSRYIHACIKADKIGKAIEFISNLSETHPIPLDESRDYLIIGDAFFKQGRMQEAIGYLLKTKELMPQNYKAYFLLGRSYLESGQYFDGCKVLERALQLKPTFAEGYYYLGIGYENTHQDHKAVDVFEKLVSIDNKNIKGFYHLKKLYAKMGREDKAIEVGNAIESIATKVIEAADWKGRSGENIYRNGNMYWTGTVSAPVFLKEGKAKFILQAKGTQAKGIWPRMVVKLDRDFVGEIDVTYRELKDYEFKKTVKPGKYQLSVSFMNDGGTLDKNGKLIEDRNLFLRRCRVVYEE